jgi:hypothetical protein
MLHLPGPLLGSFVFGVVLLPLESIQKTVQSNDLDTTLTTECAFF